MRLCAYVWLIQYPQVEANRNHFGWVKKVISSCQSKRISNICSKMEVSITKSAAGFILVIQWHYTQTEDWSLGAAVLSVRVALILFMLFGEVLTAFHYLYICFCPYKDPLLLPVLMDSHPNNLGRLEEIIHNSLPPTSYYSEARLQMLKCYIKRHVLLENSFSELTGTFHCLHHCFNPNFLYDLSSHASSHDLWDCLGIWELRDKC